MSFFISDAMAAANTAQASAGEGMYPMFMIAVIFVLFYFMLIRPQNKRQKEHQKMVSELKKGDEVITSGGILAKVTDLSEQYLKVSLADGVEVRLQRTAVSSVLPRGTMKSL
ncbi:MAG: preprotein translocase subunit YajC [Legionellaceae bacterium]|nr:preprotein translocase subunit YajC [Legionellaceae bacterium]